MKTLKLSIALAMSFASFLFASEYLGNTVKNIDSQVPSVSAFESMDSIVADDVFLAYSFIVDTANADGGDDDTKACDDPMDDLCEGNYKPDEKEISIV